MTENSIKKPLVKKPIGSIWDSKHRWAREIKCSLEPSGPVTCELCGTSHPKLPEMPTEEGDYDIDDYIYHIYDLFGYQVVGECCGLVFDRMFKAWGRAFALAYIKDTCETPTTLDFTGLMITVVHGVNEAKEQIECATESTEKIRSALKHLISFEEEKKPN